MSLRQLSAPRLRRSLLLSALLLAGSFSAQAAEEMLRKAVGKGHMKWPTASRKMRCG